MNGVISVNKINSGGSENCKQCFDRLDAGEQAVYFCVKCNEDIKIKNNLKKILKNQQIEFGR